MADLENGCTQIRGLVPIGVLISSYIFLKRAFTLLIRSSRCFSPFDPARAHGA